MTQPAADQQRQQVVAAYQQQTAAVAAQLAAALTALWLALPEYRAKQAREFAAQAVELVQAAMGHMQSITTAYLATMSGLGGGSFTPGTSKTLGITDVRNGVDPLEVYQRPFHLVWRRLHDLQPLDGPKIEQAITSGIDRAVQLAKTDVQLAKTHTAKADMARNRSIVGYRRELEGAFSCALCIVASTRRYHKAELMPIHPACDCQPVPIFEGQNVNMNLDPALLEAVHATVAQQFGADSTAAQNIRGAFKKNGDPVLYRDVLITHDHGELGPVLSVRGQAFTGPADIA